MKRGDVVIIDFPYSDRTGSKVRPSLVVQSDMLNSISSIWPEIGLSIEQERDREAANLRARGLAGPEPA